MLNRGSYYLGQEETTEKIIYFVRRHWLAIFPWALGISVLLLAQIILLFANISDVKNYLLSKNEIIVGLPGMNFIAYQGPIFHLTLIVSTCYLLLLFAIMLTVWINYYLDVTFITAQHLVNIEQRTIFIRQVSEQPLARVQDVSSKMKGFLETFFRYGTVFVETAGDAPNFEMKYIPRPHKIANTIMKLHEQAVRIERGQEKILEAGGNEITVEPIVKIESISENKSTDLPKIIDNITPIKLSNENQKTNELFIDLVQKKSALSKAQEGDLVEGEEIDLDNP